MSLQELAQLSVSGNTPELIELRLRRDQCEPSLSPQLVQLVWGRVPCDQSGNEDSGVEDNTHASRSLESLLNGLHDGIGLPRVSLLDFCDGQIK